uniref:Uncharacterized protein n=1 Tax=Zea mays TaxID=4577 RepID=C0HI98_MAIZE|nr:unknown [Zea mays]
MVCRRVRCSCIGTEWKDEGAEAPPWLQSSGHLKLERSWKRERIRRCTATKQTFFACMSRRKGHLGTAQLSEMCYNLPLHTEN